MAPSKSFSQTEPVPEQSSYVYSCDLETPAGDAVDPAQVSQIYLSLRDIRTDAIINSRSGVTVKNAHGGTLTSGLFSMQFDPEDMPAIGTEELQPRKLTLDFRLLGGGRVTREIQFWVRAMEDVDAL